MDNEYLTISLTCFFCDGELKGDTEKNYSSGDMIKCQECGELNDYDTLVSVAAKKGEEMIKKRLEGQLKDRFGKLFK